MNSDALAPVLLSKQRHQNQMIKKKYKRRALLSARRIILNTTSNNFSLTPSSILNMAIEDTLRSSDIPLHTAEDLHGLNINTNSCDHSNELSFELYECDYLNELNIDTNESGDLPELDADEYALENSAEFFNFSSCFDETDTYLHGLTSITKYDYCTKLLLLLRDAKMCKSNTDKLIQLIHSGLPTPNNLPKSMKELLVEMQVQQLFMKREVCATCYRDIDDHNNGMCVSQQRTKNANIFDINAKTIFSTLLNRLWSAITEYKKQIESKCANHLNDIPFNVLYRKMVKNIKNEQFISIMLHIDGISICVGEPKPKSWLNSCFTQLNELKNEGVVLVNGTTCKILFYSIVGDCPALKLILEFIAHNGYFCCFYCYIEGVHIGGRGGKRQYYYKNGIQFRDVENYALESAEAAATSRKVFGHLGQSILHDLLDVPLPYSIIADYLHVSLLRHTRVIVQQIYSILSPSERVQFDARLRAQKFPHFFNRKLRAVSDFSFVKGTELKNLLLYGLLPHLLTFLADERLAHVALFVCFIRSIHGKKHFGKDTSALAKELFVKYYQDHGIFFNNLQDFTLHVHLHFDRLFDHHGSLCYLGTFSQEDFIGAVSKNFHGTRFHGELITYYYEIDFALRNLRATNESSVSHSVGGPFDQIELTSALFHDINQHHLIICGCNKPSQCVRVFRRCMIDKKVYHSLIYSRRNSSVSYFVPYHQNQNDINFGKIKLFFTSNDESYALIERHEIKTKFSDFIKSSSYYDLLCKSIDYFFFVLYPDTSSMHCVPTSSIENYCVVFETTHHIIATPLSICYEHD